MTARGYAEKRAFRVQLATLAIELREREPELSLSDVARRFSVSMDVLRKAVRELRDERQVAGSSVDDVAA